MLVASERCNDAQADCTKCITVKYSCSREYQLYNCMSSSDTAEGVSTPKSVKSS